MIQHLEAVYEHGVLRPLAPVSLAESQRVTITISAPAPDRTNADMTEGDSQFLQRLQAEVAGMRDVPTLEEVQRAMSKIPGSLTEDFAAERDDRAPLIGRRDDS